MNRRFRARSGYIASRLRRDRTLQHLVKDGRSHEMISHRISRSTSLSGRDMLNLGIGDYPIPEVFAQKSGSIQINLAAEYLRQLCFHGEEVETWYVSRLEFNQDVYIALRTKILTQDGTKKCQLANVVTPTEVGDAGLGNIYPRARRS